MGPLTTVQLAPLAPGLRLSRDGRFVAFRSGVRVPTPTIPAQAAVGERPPTSLTFPLDAFGVVVLYTRAGEVLKSASVWAEVTPSDKVRLEQHLWWQAERLFRRGRPIRSAVDEFVDPLRLNRPGEAPTDDDEGDDERRFASLAAWAVVEAARTWVA